MRLEPKGKFSKVAPDQMQILEGGGCISVFGLPFFIAGIFSALVGLGIIPVENEEEVPSWSWIIIVFMGLIFTSVGGVLVFGRRWVILDISRGALVKHAGLLVPMKHSELSLHSFDAVLLRFDAGDSDSADRYIATLRAKDGNKNVDLYSSTQYGDAHEQTMLVADFLRLPLVDASTDHETVIDSHLADRSYRDEKVKEEFTATPRPAVMQTQVQESANEVQIIIQDKTFKPAKVIRCIISVFILIIIVPQFVAFFRRTYTPEIVEYVFLVIAILFFGIIPFIGLISSIVRSRRSRTIVTANTGGIRIEYYGIAKMKTNNISAADILGLDYSTAETVWKSAQSRSLQHRRNEISVDYESMGYGSRTRRWIQIIRKFVKSKGIIVKSRNGLVTFGGGLPDEEVTYIFSIITSVLGKKA